jgi:predicted nucleic acid-binding protein
MSVFVLDANIISYYLKSHENVVKNIRRAIIEKNEILIAPIAYYEVKRGLAATGSIRRLKEFEEFCETFGVGKLDNAILDIAVTIYVEQRAKGRPTDDADIFIAAFCKKNGFTLVTHNTKHFEHLNGIKIADWTE